MNPDCRHVHGSRIHPGADNDGVLQPACIRPGGCRCKTSGRVGLLARLYPPDLEIDPLSDRARGFYRETGSTLQATQDATVCFIAVENADVPAAAETLKKFLGLRSECAPAGPTLR